MPYYSYVHTGPGRHHADDPDARRCASASDAGANALASRIEQQLADIRQRVATQPRPKTLLVFGREPGSLRNIDASGGDGFLHDMLEVAGGTDVLGDIHRQSVMMSTEMVLARAPEVIVELRIRRKTTTRT